MEPFLSSCPECGGQRAFFESTGPQLSLGFLRQINRYGYTCLACGHMTLRIHPNDLKKLQEAAEKIQGKAMHPCSECGGERVFFKLVSFTDNPHVLVLGGGNHFKKAVHLYACVCLKCGSLTERPHPRDLGKLWEAAE